MDAEPFQLVSFIVVGVCCFAAYQMAKRLPQDDRIPLRVVRIMMRAAGIIWLYPMTVLMTPL